LTTPTNIIKDNKEYRTFEVAFQVLWRLVLLSLAKTRWN